MAGLVVALVGVTAVAVGVVFEALQLAAIGMLALASGVLVTLLRGTS